MKNVKVIDLYEALKSLDNVTVPLPATVNYARAINLKRLETFYTEFSSVKDSLLQKYGTTENGYNYTFSDENRPVYYKELADLLDVDVDVTIQKVSLDTIKTLELPPKYFDAIMLMAEDEVE